MTKDTSDTTPAGNIFPDFLKRDPITDSSAAIYLECKIKRTSGEKSRLIKLPSKGKDQMTRKKIVYLDQLMMQRQASLGIECGQSTGRELICLLQPRISGFHSSYIPITPPATNIKGRTISSHNFLHFGRNSQHRKKFASQDISRHNAVNMRI